VTNYKVSRYVCLYGEIWLQTFTPNKSCKIKINQSFRYVYKFVLSMSEASGSWMFCLMQTRHALAEDPRTTDSMAILHYNSSVVDQWEAEPAHAPTPKCLTVNLKKTYFCPRPPWEFIFHCWYLEDCSYSKVSHLLTCWD